ncbi:hypothetical protein B0J18DRAFT_367965 [Chaetomium sp. MPI-SDFR-AT-0129]|nr:hypothetical protein B0J18DRAFT_367965 [Chaetomium sp. MPI-SDFR-AT-0129]
MEKSLPLLQGTITLEDALRDDENVIQKLQYPERRAIFYVYLYRRRAHISKLVSRHLNLPLTSFRLGQIKEWVHGSFNVCIPIHIKPSQPGLPEKAIIRFALPYKTGDEHFFGNADEKVRCEAATYLWLQQNCPDVPIPRLYGFGFPGSRSFTAVTHERFYNRVRWLFQRFMAWLFGENLPHYFSHRRKHLKEVAYLVIEHVAEGRALSETWQEHHDDPIRRANLFKDLSRIMLSIAKIPQPRIGSWTIDNRGMLTLINRPLTVRLHQFENQNIPTDVPRNRTYGSADGYYSDILAYHNYRMRYQPNSIHSVSDGVDQLAALTTMRTLQPLFTDRKAREGPFVMTLTDLHQSNIFVDDDWRITRLIDLEWACSRPPEMAFNPPYWLSSPRIVDSARGVEELLGEEQESYARRHSEFTAMFSAQEKALYSGSKDRTNILRKSWESGTFWYMQALDCPSALYAIFMFHIQPRFTNLDDSALDQFNQVVVPYWDRGAEQFIAEKVRQQWEYEEQLRELFDTAA